MARVPALGSTRTGRVPADPGNPGASPAGLLGLQRAQGGWPAPKPILVRKTADEVVNNSDVLQDDNHLKVQLDTVVYVVDGQLVYDASTAADLKLKWDGGASFDWSTLGLPVGATAAAGSVDAAAHVLADTVVAGGVGVGTKVVARVYGLLQVTAWTTFKLQWAGRRRDRRDDAGRLVPPAGEGRLTERGGPG